MARALKGSPKASPSGITTPRIGCMVLAAGNSERFAGAKHGGDSGGKLLATLRDRPLLQYAIDAACGSQALSCSLVVGAGAQQICTGIDLRRCAVAFNARWRQGIASSIACGLALHRADDACIIMLGDQPNVTAQDLDALIDAFQTARRITALRAGDVWGAPVLYPNRDFGALMKLRGDAGAKRYAARHTERLAFVSARRADAFADVDTQADLKRLSGF